MPKLGFDLLQLQERRPPPPQKAVVAFSEMITDVAILWSTPDLRTEITESMLRSEDFFEHGAGSPTLNPDQGIWVWEGEIVGIVYPSTPDSAEEYDVEFRGGWRRPTTKEWGALVGNQNPFEEES